MWPLSLFGGEDQTGELAEKVFPRPHGNNLCATRFMTFELAWELKKKKRITSKSNGLEKDK
jgi:hypothetical protein